MAVEPVEARRGRTRVERHAQTIAHSGPRIAPQHAVRTWPDVALEKLRICGKAAIGDDDGAGFVDDCRTALPRIYANAAPRIHLQLFGAGAEE